jgi:protein-arginine kinase activator protein McsA
MECEHCKEREANVHITRNEFEAGRTRKYHVCESCGDEFLKSIGIDPTDDEAGRIPNNLPTHKIL